MSEIRILLGVSENHLKAAGEVTAYWALFEGMMDGAIETMLLFPQASAFAGDVPPSFSARASLFIRLARVCYLGSDTLAKRFEALFSDARRCGIQRNRLVHGSWLGGGADTYILSWHKRTLHAFSASLADVQSLAREIHDLHVTFMRIYNRLGSDGAPYLSADELAAVDGYWATVETLLPRLGERYHRGGYPSFRKV